MATIQERCTSSTVDLAPSQPLKPFLKWPGGKRWLVASHKRLFPAQFNRYIEPFLGAGSVFFHLQPRIALLGDTNPDVIEAFAGVKNDPTGVNVVLEQHQQLHSKSHYYQVRDGVLPAALSERAARTIYLNRTCFNGIYRVNKAGKFNVPIGTKTAVTLDTDDFESISRLLQGADLREGDFELLVDEAQSGDLLFLDPPYTVAHNQNGFIKYNEKLFSWSDQERLATSAARAVSRGVHVILTNASHASIKKLYPSTLFDLQEVTRFSSISATTRSRKPFVELVIRGR